MISIESLLPKLVSDEDAKRALRAWREGLRQELGKDDFRKLMRCLSAEGAALHVKDGKVESCICLSEMDEESLSRIQGGGWFVFDGVVSKPGRSLRKIWNTEASCPKEVGKVLSKGRYKGKYRGKHRQDVRAGWTRVVQGMWRWKDI